MISPATIDRIFEAARVEEVVGEFVQLKKSGTNMKGFSPFTDEKSPSFMVSPVKQIWKDFSSGKGGNAVSFLMEHEHYTYPEALKWLAKKYNIDIEETQLDNEQKAAVDERESMFVVSNFAKDYFHSNLFESEQGKTIGLSYFKERGYREETIKKFQLGFSLNEWDAFSKTALEKGYDIKYLEKTGLTIVKENRNIDRFKGRVMFPIHSMSGRILGFGGRILDSTEKAAKYLNSPASEIYDKSKVLYGIYYAKQAIAKENNCYLVEGYTDVITMHQAGIENVVSSSGTALTPDQIRLIKRLTPNITVLFDGDAAGIRASFRGIDLILEQDMNVKVLTFPENDDPDSYARKVSSEELNDFLKNNAQDFIKFKISMLMEEAQNDPIKKADLIRDIIKSISVIPDKIQREIYIQETSKLMEISENVLFSGLAQQLAQNNKQSGSHTEYEPVRMAVVKESQTEKIAINELEKYEKEIIRTLLLYGNQKTEFVDWIPEVNAKGKTEIKKKLYENIVAQEIYLNLQVDEIEFSNPLFQEIYSIVINQFNLNQNIDIKQFTNHENLVIAQMATDIVMDDEKYILSNWESREIYVKPREWYISKHVTDIILNLRRVLIAQKIQNVMEAITEKHPEKEQIEDVLSYSRLRKLIFDKLHRVV